MICTDGRPTLAWAEPPAPSYTFRVIFRTLDGSVLRRDAVTVQAPNPTRARVRALSNALDRWDYAPAEFQTSLIRSGTRAAA